MCFIFCTPFLSRRTKVGVVIEYSRRIHLCKVKLAGREHFQWYNFLLDVSLFNFIVVVSTVLWTFYEYMKYLHRAPNT